MIETTIKILFLNFSSITSKACITLIVLIPDYY